MEIEFLSGNALQKAVVRDVLGKLINYPMESMPLSLLKVEFTEDPLPSSHNEFAITEWEYDTGEALVKIRSDFPNFPKPYDGRQFAEETVVHEVVGHAVFANLGHARRLKIAALFGAKTDDQDVLNDQSKAWEDRACEGIAETAKDAFLPPSQRAFSNRSKRRIPIWENGKLRNLYRFVGDGFGFSYVYGSQSHRVHLHNVGLPTHLSNRDDEAFVFYREIAGFIPFWGVDMSQFEESGKLPFSIEPEGGIST